MYSFIYQNLSWYNSRSPSHQEIVLKSHCGKHVLLFCLQHFEDFVVGHFRQRAHAILESCKAYMEGAQVGSPLGVTEPDANKSHESCSSKFKTQLDQMFPMLLVAFTDNGADCRKFLPEKPDTTLKLPEKPDTTLKLWVAEITRRPFFSFFFFFHIKA